MTATAVLADPDDVAIGGDDRVARLERVRSALRRAETAAGVRPVDWASVEPPRVPGIASPAPSAPSTSPASAPLASPAPPAPLASRADATPPEPIALHAQPATAAPAASRVELGGGGAWLPAPPALAPLLPYGAIRRGSAIEATGSTAVLLHLVAALAGAEAWTVVVARPDLGLAAALAAGIDPGRLVLVPDPGPTAGSVLGALVDGFDVVVIGECAALSARDRRSLAQRVRHRGAVLLSSAPWPEATLHVTAAERSSAGLVDRGRLTSAGIVVDVSGRGGDRRRRGRVDLTPAGLVPAPGEGTRAADPSSLPGPTIELEAG